MKKTIWTKTILLYAVDGLNFSQKTLDFLNSTLVMGVAVSKIAEDNKVTPQLIHRAISHAEKNLTDRMAEDGKVLMTVLVDKTGVAAVRHTEKSHNKR